MSMSGNMAENAAGVDGGGSGGNAVDSAGKESADATEVWRPNFQWRSKPCLNVATVRPLPRSGSPEMSPYRPHSPAPSSSFRTRTSPVHTVSSSQIRSRRRVRRKYTITCPFSFDLHDSLRRVAHEQKLEELRLEESRLAVFTFRANPVRKYKPLVVNQSTRQLTVPKSPFSSGDPRT